MPRMWEECQRYKKTFPKEFIVPINFFITTPKLSIIIFSLIIICFQLIFFSQLVLIYIIDVSKAQKISSKLTTCPD